MTSLTTDPCTHVIVFYDGTKKFITTKQYQIILEASSRELKSVSTSQLGYISFGAISKIPEIEDYYNQYPEERPDYRAEFQPKIDNRTPEQQERDYQRVRQGIVKGLQDFCKTHSDAKQAKEVLNHVLGNEQHEGYWEGVVEKYKDKERNSSEEEHYQFALKKTKQFSSVADVLVKTIA